jgi:hypothetical protein
VATHVAANVSRFVVKGRELDVTLRNSYITPVKIFLLLFSPSAADCGFRGVSFM